MKQYLAIDIGGTARASWASWQAEEAGGRRRLPTRPAEISVRFTGAINAMHK